MGLEPGGCVEKYCSWDGLVIGIEGKLGSSFVRGTEGRSLGRNGGDRERERA